MKLEQDFIKYLAYETSDRMLLDNCYNHSCSSILSATPHHRMCHSISSRSPYSIPFHSIPIPFHSMPFMLVQQLSTFYLYGKDGHHENRDAVQAREAIDEKGS